MRMMKLVDEYKDTGFRIVPISMYTIDYIEKNLGDYFLHMKDERIHAISERECNDIVAIINEEAGEYPDERFIAIDNDDDNTLTEDDWSGKFIYR